MGCVVYGLRSSSSDEIRYIGQTTKTADRRLAKHLENAKGNVKSHLYKWMRAVVSRGGTVEVLVLDCDAEWCASEMRIIADYKKRGARLVNCTDGGDGTLGWKPNAAQLQKLRTSHLGKKMSPETIAKREATVELRGGRKVSAETKAKLMAANVGRKLSPETIAKRTATRRANDGYRMSDAQRAARVVSATAWWARRRELKNVAHG